MAKTSNQVIRQANRLKAQAYRAYSRKNSDSAAATKFTLGRIAAIDSAKRNVLKTATGRPKTVVQLGGSLAKNDHYAKAWDTRIAKYGPAGSKYAGKK